MKQNKFFLTCVIAACLILTIAVVSVLKYQDGSPGIAAAGAGLVLLVIVGWIDQFKTFSHAKRIGKIWPKH